MTTETVRGINIDYFSPEAREGLLLLNASIIRSRKRSLYDFEKEGRKFTPYHLTTQSLTEEQRNRVFSIKSRSTEIAYLPTSLFFFGDLRHDTYQDQLKLLKGLRDELKKTGIQNVDIIFPSVSDCMEVYDAELNSNHPINIFGKRNGYPLTRTSTEIDSSSTVIIGLDDLDALDIREELALDKTGPIDHLFGFSDLRNRGIHLGTISKDNNVYSGLYIMPIFVPA